jgi:hypothetical protein
LRTSCGVWSLSQIVLDGFAFDIALARSTDPPNRFLTELLFLYREAEAMYVFNDRLWAALLIVGMGIVLSGCGAASGSDNAATTTAAQPGSSANGYGATRPAAPVVPDRDQAQSALVSFFSALAGGRYTEAAMLYGGSYQDLVGFNPMVPPDEYPQLFQNACTSNGFQCLEIQSIVEARELAPDQFRFVVTFQNEDGSLFSRDVSSDSSASAQPTQSQWSYTVKKVDDLFLVQELPVYLP